MPSMFDIDRYCKEKKCSSAANISYKKIVTSGNNPQKSSKMLCSEYVRSFPIKKDR